MSTHTDLISNDEHADSHHGHDANASHSTLKGYMTGFVLSVILTAIPFYVVLSGGLHTSGMTALVILGLAAVQIVVHCARLSDGSRKITSISEVAGIEGDEAVLTELFAMERTGIGNRGQVLGRYTARGVKPKCLERMRGFGIKLPDALFHETQEFRTNK